MSPEAKAKLARTFAKAPAGTLIQSLRILDAATSLDQAERMARAWIIEELERRFPAAAEAVEAAFDAASDDEGVNYVAVLLTNIPEVRP